MKKAILACLALLAVGGCANTFQGVGEDVENAGEYIQDVFD